jgi:hypothetical protein
LSRRGGCGLAGAAAAKVAPQAAGRWWGETWGGAREQSPNLVSAKPSGAIPIKPSIASPRQFASPACVRAACSVWLSGSGDSGVELEARGIFLRRAPGSASEMGPQWVWAASSWQVSWLELELAVLRQLWVPFQPAIHAHDMPCQHDHFRAMVLGLQTILTSTVLMIVSSEETQPYGCSEPAAR